MQLPHGEIVGFEALLRWRIPGADGSAGRVHPGRRGDRPDRAARPLGAPHACAQLADWRTLASGAGLFMSVNVSQRQLVDTAFSPTLADALEQAGLDPRRPAARGQGERARAESRRRVQRALQGALDRYGVRSRIDDFGTGASSLRLLQGFPGDAVKIHRALVIGMGREAGAFEIVKALVGLAHNLGLEVIAEGVETATQLDHLKLLGCEFAQGFHISAAAS